ncbi:MAG: PAS domain S-box protein [Calditrichaeota bacterium]|nr:MAG: PAS domain S-box protein [Calditrichota bacterium]
MQNQDLKQKIQELEAKLEARENYSKLLQKIIISLSEVNSYKEIAALIIEESKDFLGFDSADIFLFSENKDKAILVASVGKKLDQINEKIPFVLIKGDDFLEQESQCPKINFIEDILKVPNFTKGLAEKINTCSILKVPIFVSGNYQGVFAFCTSREKGILVPNESQLNFVKILSTHISSSISKIISEQEKSKHFQNFYEVEQVANLGSWTWEAKTDILYWSDNLYEIFGIEKSEFKKDYQSFIDLLHPADKEEVTSILAQAFVDKDFLSYSHRIIHQKSNKVKLLSCRVNIVRSKEGNVQKMFGTSQDITELITFEKLKKESEERYKNLIEFIPYGLVVHTKGKILFVNNAAIKMMKAKSSNDFVGKNIQEFVHKESQEVVRERVKKIEEGEDAPTIEEKFICFDGSIIDVEVTGTSFLYNNQKCILACFQDVSDRKLIEKAKVENEENFKNIFENSPDAIFVEDYEGNVLNANRAACELHNFSSPRELIGKNVLELVPKKNLDNAHKEFTKLLDGELNQIQSLSLRNDGKEIPVEIRASKIIFNEKKALLLHVRNISERIEMEEEMLKIKKLESIGVLAGGIAHDFNNILTGILANLSLAKILLKDQSDVEARIKEAEKATIRARDLTHQLLTFAKGGLPILSIASIVNLIKDSTKFALRGSKVKSDFLIQEDLWPVDIDKGQIGQVVHNLVLNASQAMQEGGTIQISAENILLENESDLPLEQGNYVKISITDEGTGIAQQYLDKIFDPYFTTKETGSGLGLATTFSIIKNHQGHISVESKIGIGTKFSFYLKATDGSVSTQEVFSKEEIIGKGKILIMDDDEAIREILFDVLQHIGYEAVAISNGFEAIAKYEDAIKRNNKFDAVILDLTIPGSMGGGDTIERLLQIDPNVKAIVSSGYSNSPIMRNYEKFGFQAIIKKPYNVKELSEVLAKVINQE